MVDAITGGQIPLTIIAAVARNGVIGGGNQLLWRLSSDLRRFKALTMGKPMIMGRKTFDSIGRPLPGRETIVVTRNSSVRIPGAHVAATIDQALETGRALARAMGASAIAVVGGGEIYAQTIGIASRLLITHVDVAPEGDASFPAIDPAIWQETSRERGVKTDKDDADFSFAVYERA